ncbi:hypothetical protein Poly24_25370 [Rosistilla carotiformis]|uniref:Uncharacterized protein n=1 Tax=Rosistilla carotiformis TaxID=2528017 RepID=A0A518JTF9_9BACT|nr:hypothetical protein Poly24_25370 [Rosistilla carotiformis]
MPVAYDTGIGVAPFGLGGEYPLVDGFRPEAGKGPAGGVNHRNESSCGNHKAEGRHRFLCRTPAFKKAGCVAATGGLCHRQVVCRPPAFFAALGGGSAYRNEACRASASALWSDKAGGSFGAVGAV